MDSKELDYLEAFKPGDLTATVRINRGISADPALGITASDIAAHQDYLVNMGVQEIVYTINSTGGNVLQGLEIFSIINDAPVKTETQVVGIAASIAGIISQAGHRRTIKKHALWHGHGTRAEKGKTVSAQIRNIMNASLSSLLVSSAGMTEDQANEILSNETYMTAEEARSIGLFDEVLPSRSQTPDISNVSNVSEIADLFAELEDNKTKVKLKKTNDMSKVNEILNLSAEASEEAQAKAIETLQAQAEKVSALEAQIEALEKEKATLESNLKSEKTAKATQLIEAAIKEGKIDAKDEEAKASWLQAAESDFDNASKMLNSIKTVVAAADAMAHIKSGAEEVENRKDWDFAKWGSEDPKGLEKMQAEQPEQFKKLFEAYTSDYAG